MKKVLLLIAALPFFTTFSAQADEIVCASKKDAYIYFTEGQVLFRAEVNSSTLLGNTELTVKGEPKLDASTEESEGKATDKYVRFPVGSSLFCNYRLALPKDFMTKETTLAFLDAYCEEGYDSSATLSCRIQ